MKYIRLLFVVLSVSAFLLTLSDKALSASLPKPTQKLLKKFQIDPSLLGDIDKELAVPKKWIEEAKKEGKLRIRMTPARPSELKTLFASFKIRYPFIDIDFYGSNQQTRSVKTLMAYKSGRILADFMTSIGGFISEYRKANALVDLSDLPGYKVVPKEAKDAAGQFVGINQNYWCMSYNTRLVKPEQLPKKWEDLLTNPMWGKGNLGLGNRPQLFGIYLWKAKGEKWTKDYLTKLFTEVKPQLRKEGMNLLPQLVAAGEFLAAMPSNNKRPYQLKLDGAPVGFTCPEPVPVSTEDAVVLRGGNVHTAKIFTNWLLSKEGQVAQYAFEYATPLNLKLREKLLPFRNQILGKAVVYRSREFEAEVLPELGRFWNDLWLWGGGAARRRR